MKSNQIPIKSNNRQQCEKQVWNAVCYNLALTIMLEVKEPVLHSVSNSLGINTWQQTCENLKNVVDNR